MSLTLIDTHAHVCFDSYDEDRNDVMKRAFESGVKKLVHPCCTLNEIDFLLELVDKYDGNDKVNIYTAIGVHPCEIKSWNENSISIMDEKLSKLAGSKIKAVGEMGLDYYHCTEANEQERQREIFKEQIDIAQKYKLPIIVHTRDAWEDTLEILQEKFPKDRDNRSGVLHCYTGDLDFAMSCIELGFYVSWSGIVTYKKNDHFREVASKLDQDRSLIETDCPFLAPQAVRGKRNEPSYVNYVAETLADCFGISKEELAKKSTENAERLFQI